MSMFGCTCCDGVSFGNPCCISYTEPIYGYSYYTPLCGQTETGCGQSTRIEKLYDLPRNLRFCTPQGASACYVKKVTETFSIESFGCPPYEYETIRYLYPNQACLTGEVLEDGTICNQIGDPGPNPGGNGLQTRTIERVLGKIDLQSSCWRYSFTDFLRPYAYMKQTTENETKIDLNWYRWWEDFCPSCDNCKGVSITPDGDVCAKGKIITHVAKEVFSSNYCISYEEKLNTTGVIIGGITYSCDPIDGGKHYSVNDKEWKDSTYCFGGECLVPYVKIEVVSLVGVSGTGPCFPGINKCFISVDESEVYERPNPKDGSLTQSSINGGCTPQVCLNGYIFGTSNPCVIANPCLFDDFTLAECPGCPPDDGDDEEEGPSDTGSIF